MKTRLCTVLTLAAAMLAMLAAPALRAQNCRPNDIVLASQGAVDQFMSRNGPCDRVNGTLLIHGAGIQRLSGLNGLVEVFGHLLIDDTEKLADLTGLETLRLVRGDFGVFLSRGLRSLGGLDSLNRVEGSVGVFNSPALTSLDGLDALTTVGGFVAISDVDALENTDGLRRLRTVGRHLLVNYNETLVDLHGLAGLTSIGGQLVIRLNQRLTNLDGLYRVQHLGEGVDIRDNPELADLQGLGGLHFFAGPVRLQGNPRLANCAGLHRWLGLADELAIGDNAAGCNAAADIEAALEELHINAGFTDAWVNTVTPGQGFMITVLPASGKVFLGWFTWDLEVPADPGARALLGDAGTRWLTAVGNYAGRTADLELTLTRGGLFDSAEPVSNETAGNMALEFSSCKTGTVRFGLPALGLAGALPIRRLASDNEPLCELLQ